MVKAGQTTKVTITTATPRIAGTGAIGSPLTVTLPDGLIASAGWRAQQGIPGSKDPAVTWLRNGTAIPGATGLTYTPTVEDRLTSITAQLVFPTIFDGWLSGPGAASVPPPFTTSAIAVGDTPRAAPTATLSVPKRLTAGERPKVKVSVAAGATALSGNVTLKVGKKRAVLAPLRNGAATFRLPKLKAGKLRLVATYLGAEGYTSTKVAKTVTVKPRKR